MAAPAQPVLRLAIDADSIVRMSTARVDVEIQAQANAPHNEHNAVWKTLDQRSLRPDPALDWPWAFQLNDGLAQFDRFSLSATARDRQGAVVGRVTGVRERPQAFASVLRLHFDAACFRRNPLCDEGLTCAGGNCVDPAAVSDAGTDELDSLPDGGVDAAAADASSGIASAGASCQEGLRACTDLASRTPLLCEEGRWQPQSACLESEHCDATDGPTRGSCVPIAEECANRPNDAPFCVGEDMRVCTGFIASTRPCAEHERCVPDGDTARCACGPGFVSDGQRCAEATDCGAANGGCDLLTRCSMSNGVRSCSACPDGFTGTGDQGCQPQLLGLSVEPGALTPRFDVANRAYRISVPLLVQRVQITPEAPSRVAITLNGAAVAPGATWTSPALPVGESKYSLLLTSEAGVSSAYALTVERTGSEEAYIKADHGDDSDQFGFWVSLSGDTLVATAWFEDSAATGVNGDQENNSANDSGAAYVYVRSQEGWKSQAYLKASDVSPNEYFGVRADVEGDTIVVGALGEGIYTPLAAATRPGAAYVYARTDGQWRQLQRLAASPASGADLFGSAVVLDGDRLAIGAPWESTTANRSGAVYLFERSNGVWKQVQMLKSSKPHANALFGSAVALEGDHLVAGAPNDSEPATNTGSAEIFVRQAGMWRSQQWLQPTSLGEGANFGFSAALHAGRVAVGAPHTRAFLSTTDTPPGELFVFDANAEQWMQTALLKAEVPHDSDFFGANVVLMDDALAVAASGDPSGSIGLGGDPTRTDAKFSGAVYLYVKTSAGWVQSTYIKPHNTDPDDAFGYALAVDADTIAVGATLESGTARGINNAGASSGSITSGAVYVFR